MAEIIFTEKDIRVVPFSPLTEKDRAEFRAQFFNNGDDGEFCVKFFLDSEDSLLFSEKIKVSKKSYGFSSCFKENGIVQIHSSTKKK